MVAGGWVTARRRGLAGVLNTDNMSILGLTLDYGPYGFMDTCVPACCVSLAVNAGGECK